MQSSVSLPASTPRGDNEDAASASSQPKKLGPKLRELSQEMKYKIFNTVYRENHGDNTNEFKLFNPEVTLSRMRKCLVENSSKRLSINEIEDTLARHCTYICELCAIKGSQRFDAAIQTLTKKGQETIRALIPLYRIRPSNECFKANDLSFYRIAFSNPYVLSLCLTLPNASIEGSIPGGYPKYLCHCSAPLLFPSGELGDKYKAAWQEWFESVKLQVDERQVDIPLLNGLHLMTKYSLTNFDDVKEEMLKELQNSNQMIIKRAFAKSLTV